MENAWAETSESFGRDTESVSLPELMQRKKLRDAGAFFVRFLWMRMENFS
ncbi:MAG: hypothetical protein LUF78_07940 [Clostridiales bacterium]|nr:hypothetical protein [Clostridiales bacterium]